MPRNLAPILVALAAGCGPVTSAPEPYVPGAYVVTLPAVTPAPDATITSGPFGAGQVWTGTYYCPQGDTELRFIVLDAYDYEIRALFDFYHPASGAKGTYVVNGKLDPRSGKVRFRPQTWIVRPEHYVMVGMAGSVSGDLDRMSGRITHEACGGFDLTLQKGSGVRGQGSGFTHSPDP